MEMEKLRNDLEEAKRGANELSQKFVALCALIKNQDGEIQNLKDKLWLSEGRLRKENKLHFELFRLITMYCNGEKTLDQLRRDLRSRGPLLIK